MAEKGDNFGGEQSGHVIFREGDRWYGDGVYTGLRVLETLSTNPKRLLPRARFVPRSMALLVQKPVSVG